MKKFTLTATLLASSLLFSSGTFAEGSVQHFADSAQHLKQSTQHTAGSIGHTLVGSGKLISGVVALPFKAIGKAGEASSAVGELLWDNATGQSSLEVTENTVTAGPAPMVAVNL
jgi:hypothetical protein